MTDSDPAHDTFVAQPREHFVDQPRADAVRSAPAEPSRAARTTPAAGDQRSTQSPAASAGQTATPAPGVVLVHQGSVGRTGLVRVTVGELGQTMDGTI